MISGAPPFSSIGFPDGRLPRPLWWRRSEGGRQPFHDTGGHDDYDDGFVQDQDEGDDEGKEVNDIQTRQWVIKSANHNLQDKPCSNKNRAKRKSSKQLNPYLRNMVKRNSIIQWTLLGYPITEKWFVIKMMTNVCLNFSVGAVTKTGKRKKDHRREQ